MKFVLVTAIVVLGVAASSASSQELRRRVVDGDLCTDEGTVSCDAKCPAGYLLTGGSCVVLSINGNKEIKLVNSGIEPQSTIWRCRWEAPEISITAQAKAICLQLR
jgi:hypothetical protein